MSGGEIAFLALGALLGGIFAGGVISSLRRRDDRPNVRLTVAPSSVSTLSATTLSGATGPWSGAARGGPADPNTLGSSTDARRDAATAASSEATTSSSPNALGPDGESDRDGASKSTPVQGVEAADEQPAEQRADRTAEPIAVPVEPVAVAVEPEEQLDFRTLIERRRAAVARQPYGVAGSRVNPVNPGIAVFTPSAADARVGVMAPVAVTTPVGLVLAKAADASGEPGGNVFSPTRTAQSLDEPAVAVAEAATIDVEAPGGEVAIPPERHAAEPSLLDHRQAVQERCALADRLKAVALMAADTLRSEQRAYDVCVEQIRKDELALDGRAIRSAKDAAQSEFRQARSTARSHADVEAAARTWLRKIDSVNHAARLAATRLSRDRQTAATLAVRLERLSLEADAARIAAEAAAEACMTARRQLAAAEQGLPVDEAEHPVSPSAHPQLIPLDPAAPLPFIARLLRGDHGALGEVVARLAASDRDEQRRWQLEIAKLVDGLVARALEMAWLEFPVDDAFWGMFSLQQDRDIAKSLASLGYRFDGIAGFADGRVPGQRELSLAVGYAGLDPMRIRRWPDASGLAALYNGVRVEAAEFVAAEAPSLTLGQLVSVLGQRAEQLTDVWNSWGRVRPILLATA